jgi:hypothetical protein
MVVFTFGYLAYLWVSELVTNINPIEDRFLVPIFAFVVVLAVFSLDQLLDSDLSRRRRWPGVVVAAGLGLWLASSLVTSIRLAQRYEARGRAFASPEWTMSELVDATRLLPRRATVFSNEPGAIYSPTRRQPTFLSPRRTHYRSNERVDDFASFRSRVAHGDAFLVWVGSQEAEFLYTPEQLELRGIGLEEVAETSEGTIYRVAVES